MRVLLALAVCVVLGSSAWAGGEPGSAGGGPGILPDPGFCWGGGIIPQPPPDFCWGDGVIPVLPGDTGGGVIIVGPPADGLWPGEMAPGSGVTPTLGPTGPAAMSSANSASGSTSTAATTQAQQAAAPPRTPASQMYIPPAVWKWVAAHPARVR